MTEPMAVHLELLTALASRSLNLSKLLFDTALIT
jgi:hypothetical protein